MARPGRPRVRGHAYGVRLLAFRHAAFRIPWYHGEAFRSPRLRRWNSSRCHALPCIPDLCSGDKHFCVLTCRRRAGFYFCPPGSSRLGGAPSSRRVAGFRHRRSRLGRREVLARALAVAVSRRKIILCFYGFANGKRGNRRVFANRAPRGCRLLHRLGTSLGFVYRWQFYSLCMCCYPVRPCASFHPIRSALDFSSFPACCGSRHSDFHRMAGRISLPRIVAK